MPCFYLQQKCELELLLLETDAAHTLAFTVISDRYQIKISGTYMYINDTIHFHWLLFPR